jgi:hypothetical protein
MMEIQQDFNNLSGSGSHCSGDTPNLADYSALMIGPSRRSSSASSIKTSASACVEDFNNADQEQRQISGEDIPQNLNSKRREVLAYLTAWVEAEARRRADPHGSGDDRTMDVDFVPGIRIPDNAGPPRLFYITFWRSLTRRLLQSVEKASSKSD